VFHVKHSRPTDSWQNPRVSRIATGSWRSRHSARRQPTRSAPRGIQPARPASRGGRLAGPARSAPRGVQPARPASRGRRLMRPPTPRLVVSGRQAAGAPPCTAEPARPASRGGRGGGAGTIRVSRSLAGR